MDRVLLETLIVAHLVKEFSEFYGTQMFFTVLTKHGYWTVFRAT
jgi:hypothetical protein